MTELEKLAAHAAISQVKAGFAGPLTDPATPNS
jgi:hypothetical protein